MLISSINKAIPPYFLFRSGKYIILETKKSDKFIVLFKIFYLYFFALILKILVSHHMNIIPICSFL